MIGEENSGFSVRYLALSFVYSEDMGGEYLDELY